MILEKMEILAQRIHNDSGYPEIEENEQEFFQILKDSGFILIDYVEDEFRVAFTKKGVEFLEENFAEKAEELKRHIDVNNLEI